MKFRYVIAMFFLVVASINLNAAELNPNNPDGYKHFRLNYFEMVELANPTRLQHRIFYTKPSAGPNAKWFDAVKQGDIETIKRMVDQGQDIEVKDEASWGQTALGWAAFIGYEDIVDFLLSKNANLMATDRGDVSNALKSAGLGKNVAVFDKIYQRLKNEVDLDNQSNDREGETILIVASSNDRVDIVNYLLDKGARTDLVTTVKNPNHHAYNQSAFSIACKNGNYATIKILQEKGAINHRNGKAYCDF